MEKELQADTPIDNAFVFFLTASDCGLCSGNTYAKIHSIVWKNPNHKMFGLYLTLPRKNPSLHAGFVAETKEEIQWTHTSNTQLFGQVSQQSDKHHSPFVIEIKANKIKNVLSLSKG